MTTADARLTLALNLAQAAGGQALASVGRCYVGWTWQGERVTDVDREVVASAQALA